MSKTLDINQKHKTEYCIPLFLRDEQIKQNISKVKGRIAPHHELRNEPIAIVCFGPSLNDTWENIKDFKHVMTCSGAHKFLVDRGITPSHHLEVDPREHKIKLLGQPQKETEYLISSTCHPKYLDLLEGYNVKLWHVFDTQEEGLRLLPRGEWAITGGCSVGLRAMTMARFLGFTELHIFGMDGCFGKSGTHASEHPNAPPPPGYAITEYEGVRYQTTTAVLECAKQTWHELDQMVDVKATFYGEGLVQAMAKKYVRKPTKNPLIGFQRPEVISAEYAALNAQLHKDNLLYGVGGGKHADLVIKLVQQLRKDCEFVRVLDYGCGKGYLAKALPFPIDEYDPAVPGKQESPKPAELVVATDVLEHIEEDKLIFVLDDLRRVTKRLAYFVIHTGPSSKTLKDGRNTHLIQKGQKWWREQLGQFFFIKDKFNSPLLYIVATPKPKTK